MRTGAAAGHTGYFHEALCYGSDDELLAVVVPFLREGIDVGEPTIVALGARAAGVVRSALTPAEIRRIAFHGGGDMYARPAAAIRSYRKLLADNTAAGAEQIRVLGEIPSDAHGATWDSWARYEAAINHAYDEFPLWGVCAYDTRTTPRAVLDDVAATHPTLAAPGDRHLPNSRYVWPERFLARPHPVDLDPLQLTEPAVALVDPEPAAARAALSRLNRTPVGPVLDELALSDLHMAVTETLVNAQVHGVPPVELRCWVGSDRVVVTVTDRGSGPTDPFAGLRPAAHAPVGGLGLWLTHQLCDHVSSHRGADHFTVRLISGNPHHRAAGFAPLSPARRSG